VVFNEIMYHPAGNAPELEWIELYNQMSVDIDLSHWTIDGAGYEFPNGTVLAGGDHLVVATSPGDLELAAEITGVLGPINGSLSNGGERLRLINHNDRVMDTLDYNDQDPWPVAADGGGATVSKILRDSASEPVANWASSDLVGGTPGEENFPELTGGPTLESLVSAGATTRVLIPTDDSLEDTWNELVFDDAAWTSGPTGIGFDDGQVAVGDAAPLGYWSFDGDVADGSTNSHDGVLNGATFSNETPPAISGGQSLSFDGADDFVSVVIDVSETTHSMAMWFKAESSGRGLFAVVDSDLGVGGHDRHVYLNGSNIAARTWSDETITGNGLNLSDGEWHHVVHVVGADVSGQRLYVDGTLAASGNKAFSDFNWQQQINIGFSNDAGAPYFDGFIDEVAVWDAVLNETQIEALAQGASPLALSGYDSLIGTDVEATMYTSNASAYLRTALDVDDPGAFASMTLRMRYDDGFVAYLNGFKVAERNAPAVLGWNSTASAEHSDTLATQPEDIDITSHLDKLVPGENILAIQGLNLTAGDDDFLMVPQLLVYRGDGLPPGGSLEINEVSGAGDAPFFVEVINDGDVAIPLDNFVLAGSLGPQTEYKFSDTILDPGEMIAIDHTQLGFLPSDGEIVFFYTPGRDRVLDAVRVDLMARARSPQHDGRWMTPDSPTSGTANSFAFHDEIVINEIMYHHQPLSDGANYIESDEQWIELFNRSDQSVDLSGWALDDAVDYEIPAGTMLDGGEFLVIAKHGASLAALYPGITILGDFGGNLSSSSDNIVLLDENKNIADEVRYFDGGYWHDAADGGGGSLELRDPYADNTKAEAWAPSDESASSPWQTYQYTMTATQPVWQPSISFHELRVGLLTGGEVWIDDVSVIRDPGGANVELMQNGSFGTGSDKWRLLGTHSNSEIIDDGGNNVMRIVADGPMNYLNNRLESTLAFGEQVQNGVDYKISYRAKWIWGSNQLHTELYYNRVVKTTHIEAPQLNGTPGAENSRYIANAGPTYDAFQHGPVVPDVGEDVTVSAVINDPDGVDPATAKVWWSVDGGAWSSSPMTDQGAGLYSGQVPGQAAGVVVQFYVEAADLLGAVSTFPAAGPDSRALFEVQDNRAQLGTKHNVRFIMLSSEASAMTPLTNILSNQRIGTTVVYNESEVFYDAGVRLRGSMFSRNGQNGFNIGLQPHQLFRGVHDSITLKRSGTQEIVVKHMNAKAGGIPAMYDDVVRIISSVNNITGNGTMSMARFGDDFLDSQYDNGSDGTVFKMEGIRVITSTVDGNPESLKVAFPVGWVGGFDMTDQGDDPEQYRWTWKINNNRREDNYDPMVALAKTLSLNGQELEDAIAEVMDVNQLTRVFAMLSLAGIGDTYTQGNPHNFNVYSPADGGPMIAMPWDWDFTFNRGTSSPLWGNKNLSKVFARPKYTRLFMGNMLDLIEKTYNTDYMTDWINHYGSLLGINLGGYPGYITNRTNFVQSQFPAETAFAITTPEPVTESGLTTTLQGNAWIDVKEFRIAGVALPLERHYFLASDCADRIGHERIGARSL
jgi:hypothetical protein